MDREKLESRLSDITDALNSINLSLIRNENEIASVSSRCSSLLEHFQDLERQYMETRCNKDIPITSPDLNEAFVPPVRRFFVVTHYNLNDEMEPLEEGEAFAGVFLYLGNAIEHCVGVIVEGEFDPCFELRISVNTEQNAADVYLAGKDSGRKFWGYYIQEAKVL